MVPHSFYHFGDCDHLYVILQEVDNYPNIEVVVYYALATCCQLPICTPRRQIFPPCFKENLYLQIVFNQNIASIFEFCPYEVRHIFGRVCLQRVFESTAALYNGKIVDMYKGVTSYTCVHEL